MTRVCERVAYGSARPVADAVGVSRTRRVPSSIANRMRNGVSSKDKDVMDGHVDRYEAGVFSLSDSDDIHRDGVTLPKPAKGEGRVSRWSERVRSGQRRGFGETAAGAGALPHRSHIDCGPETLVASRTKLAVPHGTVMHLAVTTAGDKEVLPPSFPEGVARMEEVASAAVVRPAMEGIRRVHPAL